jgi:hypothetical protein
MPSGVKISFAQAVGAGWPLRDYEPSDLEPRRFVFHGVHVTLDGRPGRPWKPTEPLHLEQHLGPTSQLGRFVKSME